MRNRFPVTLWLTLVALVAALALPARANTWPLPPPGSRLVGQNQFHVVQDDGGSLEAIAKKYNVGFLALLQANPGVDPYVPRAGSVLTIPLQTLLPDAPREGLGINLAELRLYYYPPAGGDHHHTDDGHNRVRQTGQSDLDTYRQHSRALQGYGD